MNVKKLPQTNLEMIESETARKDNRLYRAATKQLSSESISRTVSNSIAELVAMPAERLSLIDTPRVKAQSLEYLKACEHSGTIPTISGLARSFGLSRRALYDYQRRNPESETALWLEQLHDLFSDILSSSALNNDVQPVVSIFLQKALYGLRDTAQVEIIDNANLPFNGTSLSADDIAKKYSDLPED